MKKSFRILVVIFVILVLALIGVVIWMIANPIHAHPAVHYI